MVSFDTLGTDDDTTYYYDGEGQRVMKAVGGSGGPVTIYVYNALRQLVAEYATRWRPLSGTQYLTSDHLGSTRVVTGSDGGAPVVVSRHDYLPFGEEILGRGGRTTALKFAADPVSGPAQKFTGMVMGGSRVKATVIFTLLPRHIFGEVGSLRCSFSSPSATRCISSLTRRSLEIRLNLRRYGAHGNKEASSS